MKLSQLFRKIYQRFGGKLMIFAHLFYYHYGAIFAQNMIPNPGFEANSGLPVFLSEWNLVNNWTNGGSLTTPDYFHALAPTTGAASLPNNLFATVSAHGGNGIMGFYNYLSAAGVDYREYIQTQLISPLTPGKTYEVSFWLTNGKPIISGMGGSDGLGLHFSDLPVSQTSTSPSYNGPINVIPEFELTTVFGDSLWQNFQFHYIPSTAVSYLTIGNFKDNASTNLTPSSSIGYFFVDDFSVISIMTIDGPDSICEGQTLILDASFASTYEWRDPQNPNIVLGSGSSLSFVPTTSGSMMVIGDGDTAIHDFVVIPSRNLNLGPDTVLCPNTSLIINGNQGSSVNYLWNIGVSNPQIQIDNPGTYILTISYDNCSESDTIEVIPLTMPTINLGLDTIICTGQSLSYDFSSQLASILWSDGDTNLVKNLMNEGDYWVEATNQCGVARDKISISVVSTPHPELGSDTSFCEGSSLNLQVPLGSGHSTRWSNGSTDSIIQVQSSGLYWVEVSSVCGTVSDSIEIIETAIPWVDLGRDTSFCLGETINLDATFSDAEYLWENGDISASRQITDGGIYWVLVANECGYQTDTISLEMNKPPQLVLGPDTAFCKGESILLDAIQEDDEATYLWNDGTTEPFTVAFEPGTYEVKIKNQCGEIRDRINISQLSPPMVNLGNDTTLCADDNQILFIDVTQPYGHYIWNDQSTSPIKEISEPGIYEVTIANDCGIASDKIEVKSEICECQFFFPNAFTPNDDGHNDRFGPVFNCNVALFTMKIYDRWGKKIFSTHTPDHKWNGYFKGKLCAEGVYVWQIQYKGSGGSKKEIIQRGGTVTLLR